MEKVFSKIYTRNLVLENGEIKNLGDYIVFRLDNLYYVIDNADLTTTAMQLDSNGGEIIAISYQKDKTIDKRTLYKTMSKEKIEIRK